MCKYISNILIPSMATKTKKPSGPCFQDADNVKALMAGATPLEVSAVRVVVVVWGLVEVGSLGSLGSCSGSPGNLKGTCNEREANI